MRAWAGLIAGVWSLASAAVTPLDVTDQGAPQFTAYTSQDGLSDEIWSAVDVDARGFVWAGSASQLARFDGYGWTLWPTPWAHSLVRDIERDANGALWMIFEREGLARLDGDDWVPVADPGGFLFFFNQALEPGGKPQIQLAHGAGIFARRADQWVLDLPAESAAGAPPHQIEYTRTLFGGPRQWLGTDRGLAWRPVVDGKPLGEWQAFEDPLLADFGFVRLLATIEGGHEELWALGFGAGLVRIRDDGIRAWRARTGELPTESIYSMRSTRGPSGERWLWVASRAGLLRLRGDEVQVFDRRHGLPSDAVRNVEVQRGTDGPDILWLATEGGLARTVLGRSQWRTVSLLGQRENGIFGLMLEPDGRGGERLWVGSMKEGLRLLEQGQWRSFTAADGSSPSNGIRHILRLPGRDGRPWRLLTTIDRGMYEIRDDFSFQRLPGPWDQVADDMVYSVMARKHAGEIEYWFATARSGLHRLRAGHFTSYQPFGEQPIAPVIQLSEQIDAQGRSWLWAASGAGLLRFDNQHWSLLPASSGLPDDGYRAATLLQSDGRTVLWAGSNRHGVVRLDVADPSAPRLIESPPLPSAPDPTIYTIVPDSQGRIYICTNNGVQQLVPEGSGWSERVFRRRDGLVHDECNTNSQLIDSLDRYWVGTLGGLSVYDPRIEVAPAAARAKPLYLTQVRIDGQQVPVSDGRLEIPAGARELQLRYSLLAQQRESETRYRTQLVGYDTTPGNWTGDRDRSFTGLPAGAYELHVEARDFAGIATAGVLLAFTVEPHWWQRRPVQALGLLLAPLLLLLSVMLYNRNLRQRQALLKRQVEARTGELAEANRRLTELSYQDPLTGVCNRRRLTEALDGALARSREKRLPLGVIVIDVDHFKAYNDRHGHLAGDAALRSVAQALDGARRQQDLVARYGGEEFACLLVDADSATTQAMAERMRTLVAGLPAEALGNAQQTVTISVGAWSGIAAASDTPADLLARADAALFEAKRSGRNRVCIA